jgi:hypothetical protein
MTQRPTEAEFALSKRLAALEKASAQGSSPTIWTYITSVLPVPLLVGAGALFLSFYAWDYYNKGQQEAAKTKIARAEAALAIFEGTTANLKIGDLPAQTAKLKADLERAQADVANKQAQAAKARAAADAAMSQSGYYTLEERAARARLIISEMKAALARSNAQTSAGINEGTGGLEGAIRGLCAGNRYAALIDCPLNFIAEVDPVAAKKIADEQAAKQAAAQAKERAEKQAENERQKKLNLRGVEVFEYTSRDREMFLPVSSDMTKGNRGVTIRYKCNFSILTVHRDASGVDDFYKMNFDCTHSPSTGGSATAVWVPAPIFNEQRSSMILVTKAQLEQEARDAAEQQAQQQLQQRANLVCRGQWAALDQTQKSCMQQAKGNHNIQWYNDCVRTNAQLDEICKDTPGYPR